MSYRHFGNIGDVWKHLALCEVLQVLQPEHYIETNAAYPEYPLSPTPEKVYGIYSFLERASRMASLQNSSYFRLEAAAVRSGHYVGSPGLALKILRGRTRFSFWDLEAGALGAIGSYAKENFPNASFSLHQGDAIEGLLTQLQEGLSPAVFLHIDPYQIFETNDQGHSFWHVFVAAVRQGLPSFLWYGYHTLQQQQGIREQVRELGKECPVSLGEIWLSRLIQEKTFTANPGILGAGIAVAHLGPQALLLMKALLEDLALAYEGSYFDGHYPGDLSRQWISHEGLFPLPA